MTYQVTVIDLDMETGFQRVVTVVRFYESEHLPRPSNQLIKLDVIFAKWIDLANGYTVTGDFDQSFAGTMYKCIKQVLQRRNPKHLRWMRIRNIVGMHLKE